VDDGPRTGGQTGANPDIEVRDSTEVQPLRHPFRAFFARHRTLDVVYRVAVGVVGGAIVLGGLALIPLPGPGWLIVFGGLALLATEFAWAGRLLDFARGKVRGWTQWVGRQSLAVRAGIGLVGLLLVAGAVWAYLAIQGVPGWLPFD
jgi:uncharacterized protein (TIGR02611 family)